VTTTGWPAHSMHHVMGVTASGTFDHGRIELPNWIPHKRFVAGSRPQVPLLPLWPGFALNSLFYATLTFLLWSTLTVTRRTLRKRRGQCPACGYSRRGLPDAGAKCPECGA
jgi:hypothetical protein